LTSVIIEKIFGHLITNSDGKQVSTRDIAEQHVLEDFGNRFIPTVCDYLGDLEFVDWMNGTLNKNKESVPRSFKKIHNRYPIKKETQVSVPVDMNPDEGKTYPGAMNPDPPTKKPIPNIGEKSPANDIVYDGKALDAEPHPHIKFVSFNDTMQY
jgi:hypothetical protein